MSSNELGRAASPYLLQHADNPVHWRMWGEGALREAQAANKPILLSVGYAACHWCHVMAHESFEDPDTAAVMNELFVNIKVDREERPDIDHIYMSALHAFGERGGWPMTMFLTPTGEPFWGGTYFPKSRAIWPAGLRHRAAHGRRGLPRASPSGSRIIPKIVRDNLCKDGAHGGGSADAPISWTACRRRSSISSIRPTAACAARRNSRIRRSSKCSGAPAPGSARRPIAISSD